jgi:dihydroflavonol-4-reductase
MRSVVTGAAGHVGANLVRLLLERGHRVRATIYEDTRGLDGLEEVEQVRVDVLDPESLAEAFRATDVVFHLAAVISIAGDEDRMQQVNVEGTRNVAEACLACGVKRMVHFSSIHAFSHLPEGQPITETRGQAEPGAMFYDLSKAAGERQVLKAAERGLEAVILNPTAILGPFDYKPSHMGQVLLDLGGRKFPALVDGGFDWVDVRDVVQAAVRAAKVGRSGERYLLSGRWAPFQELAAHVEEVTGVRAPRWVSPMWLARVGAPFASTFNRLRGKRPLYTSSSLRALRCHKWVVSDKAREGLGYRPRPLRETIRDTFAWFEEAGMLG